MLNRRLFTTFALLSAAAPWLSTATDAQTATSFETEQTKTELYFGSDLGGGQAGSEQDWDAFVSSVIQDRFPSGFTVVQASGKGARAAGPLTRTRIVIVVHPAGADAEARVSAVKAEYKKRFGTAGVFQVDEVVRVRQ